ncbi:hypothetical protein WH52_09870 [Tenacibaculum holothuriorum]|uniref:Lipocalin-like domain-containing protein n=1 Tax=Tenacibaculum holothuriorum TaxID=1635173 RepID=A0A1Y2PD56_9FLAO|nr:hypothetical protein [Tenacibaculum holothuriorum]OSY87727.1 hypothetical protein WH52_09870 [Tenacibaculum holothuriorum]
MKTITNKFKLALAAIGLLAIGSVNAQQTSGNVTKQDGVNYGTTALGGSIKVIDNKGTIKYLQVKNGLTQLTNTTGDVTTTTWQLGGSLTDDTTITLGSQSFTLDGAEVRLSGTDAVDTTTESAATSATATTGYMLLTRDQANGKVKRLLLSDLIQSVQATVEVSNTTTDLTYTTSFEAPLNKIFVFRNGAKLRAGQDYTVSGTTITLVPETDNTSRNYWTLMNGDEIEYQYSK